MTTEDSQEMQRVRTGIVGLDLVLSGGLLRGGVYIVQGAPGAGKTILANQVAFQHALNGGKVVFITLLAESHTRMLQHLRSLSFYDENAIPSSVYYVSGFAALETDGLKGVVDLVRREIRGHRASLLVIDGFGVTEEAAPSLREFKKFIHEIQSYASIADCTVLLLTNGTNRQVTPEYTMVDGLMELDDQLYDQRSARSIQVRKFRGSSSLRGQHAFRITQDGVVVFPRIEALYRQPSVRDALSSGRIETGTKGLDEILKGGLPANSTYGLLGPTGSGKTMMGLHFISKATSSQPGLFYGCYESPPRLKQKASATGVNLHEMEATGLIEFMWRPQGEYLLDELAYDLLGAIDRKKVKRLVLDGFGGFIESATHPQRMSRFLSAFSNELRARGVTGIITFEMKSVFGTDIQLPLEGMSSLLEGLFVARNVELEGKSRRVFSVVKLRDSDFDPLYRELEISNNGVAIGQPFKGFEALMSGYARQPNPVGPE